jgi:hypothetical protein
MRIGALRVVVYLNDHRPAHVHVIGRGNNAIFDLNASPDKVSLRDNYGFSFREIKVIRQAIVQNHAFLLAEWEKIHGPA